MLMWNSTSNAETKNLQLLHEMLNWKELITHADSVSSVENNSLLFWCKNVKYKIRIAELQIVRILKQLWGTEKLL